MSDGKRHPNPEEGTSGEVLRVTRRRLTPKDRLDEIAAARASHVEAIKKLDAKRDRIIEETRRAAAAMLEQVNAFGGDTILVSPQDLTVSMEFSHPDAAPHLQKPREVVAHAGSTHGKTTPAGWPLCSKCEAISYIVEDGVPLCSTHYQESVEAKGKKA